MQSNGTIRIAVQRSGRLSEGSLDLLKNMGLQFETYQNRLFTRCRNESLDILFLRDDDIPEYVQNGTADLGIVGSNLLDESGAKVERMLSLDFGFCTLAIAVPEQSNYKSIADLSGKKIATSYPQTLKRYLADNKVDAEVIVLKGCVEIAPALQVADAICDLVSTGSTLRTNRLKVLEVVSKSQATLICTPNRSGGKKELIDRLLLRANGVLEAGAFKYIMFNLPEKRLKDAKVLVPGCDSPTVIPLADPQMVAVHSVVEEERFWEVVEKIKGCGGSGILVSPIEKFIR
ncbi:ATP phosphoribosyltransferase [Patescibacteria group bacterium]|nr:ATP phosphoribosyltransferase [Patescibacteria group bacterium]